MGFLVSAILEAICTYRTTTLFEGTMQKAAAKVKWSLANPVGANIPQPFGRMNIKTILWLASSG